MEKPAVAAAVLLLVCAAVYMNWRYTDNIQKNAGKTLGQTTLVSSQDGEKGQEPTAAPAEDDYFATARLSRKQARDNAISMLREAESDENAQQSVLNEASQTLQVLAAYTVAESQIESLVTAKGYADCVVFMGAKASAWWCPGGGRPDCHRRRPHQGHRHQRNGLYRRTDQDHGGKLIVVFPGEKWYTTLILGLY